MVVVCTRPHYVFGPDLVVLPGHLKVDTKRMHGLIQYEHD